MPDASGSAMLDTPAPIGTLEIRKIGPGQQMDERLQVNRKDSNSN